MQKAIILDIDNCLLDISLPESFKDCFKDDESYFRAFERFANVPEIVPKIKPMFQLAQVFSSQGYEIILVTARSIRIGTETMKYLQSGEFQVPFSVCYSFRQECEEGIEDWVLKLNRVKSLMKKFDIVLAIDDNEKNCEMYRNEGIPVLRYLGGHDGKRTTDN